MPEVLTLRRLNRATLTRQMLNVRSPGPLEEVVARLVGMQAQQSIAPFVGLWTRVAGLRREQVAEGIHQRRLVKATFVRGTLHLVTAPDFLKFRPEVQPVLSAASASINKSREAQVDLEPVLRVARQFFAEQPRTFAELTTMLSERFPDSDVRALRYAVRTHLPMVQVPVEGSWSFPSAPAFTLAEEWLGASLEKGDRLEELFHRYLAAFGPAAVNDFQTWSGLRLKERIDEFRDGLEVYRDEGKRELFDLPGSPLPAEDIDLPVRFLPEFDNLLLAHQKRTRVIAEEHRSKVYLPGLRVAPTVLVDGFVAGTWKVTVKKKPATLEVHRFVAWPGAAQKAAEEQADGLVRFIAPDALGYEVRFV